MPEPDYQPLDPTTGAPLDPVHWDSASQVEDTISRVHAHAPAWREQGIEARAAIVRRLGELMTRDRDALAALITREMGKPIREARAEVEKCAGACEYFADEAVRFLASEPIATDASRSWVQYDPLGVVLAIMPWNFPLWQVIRFVAPNLVAGNVGLLKHASSVQGCARALAELAAEAGAADAFRNLAIDSDVVGGVIDDRRIAAVTLTGSVGAGRAVAERAGRALKPCVLELGGSDPFIVLDDADLDGAAAAARKGRFLNSGQSCIAAKRLIVTDAVHDAFVERLLAEVDGLVVGDPADDATDIGPLAREDLRDDLHDQVRRALGAGATLARGGSAIDRAGWFYAPTVLTDVQPGAPTAVEEVFGPVASVIRVDDAAHALAVANTSDFGLGAAVWTHDDDMATSFIRLLAAGHVSVNGIVKSDARLPFGGIKDSGFGRELSRAGALAFTNQKSVWVR